MFEDLISGAKTTDLGPGEVLPIGGEEMAWTIVDGVVELYATLTAAGWGKRIGRLEEGEILFGIAATAPVELSLRAAPTARLAIVSTGEFEKCRVDPELAYGLERWVIALSGCLCEGEAEGAFVNLSRNRTTSIQAGKRVRPSYDVSWVRAAGGGWSFLDDHVLALSDSTFPLAPSTWLTCVEDGELSVLPTDAYLERVSPWGDLAQFHATVLGLIGQRLRQEAEDELTRVRASRKAGEQMFEGAIAGLSSILGRANDGFKFAREDGEEEAELAVCRLVGERMGIEINARPGTLKSLETPGQRISEIARHSNVRLRRIGFAPGWWKGEGVPTIGFSSVDQRVVALLPRSRRGYDVIDPKNGTRARMTDDVAPELCPVGYILYRPLPSRVISTFEFIRFGLQGSIRDLLTAVAAGFAICLLSIVIPLAARWIFDAGVPLGDRQGLLILAGAAGVGVLASTLFQLVVNVALLRGTGRISDVLEPAIWDRLLRLPLSFFRGFPSGDLAERAMAISSVRQRITTATLALLLGGVYGLAHLILLFVFDAPLGVIALGLVLVAFVGTLASSVHELKQQRCLRETHQGIASRLLEYLGSIAKIRVAGVEKSVFSIWARDLAAEKRITHQSHRARSRLAVLHSVFPIVILFLFVLIISTRDVPIESTGTFVGFTIAFGAFLASALETVSTLRTLLGAISRVERVRPILDAVPSIEATDPWIDLEGHIEMDHVSFGYSAELAPVVEDVSLEIRVGESVAIFGPSGAGKSTILRLLLGFERPQSGSVYYDGHDLASLDAEGLRNQIGIVLQDTKLLPGSIQQNIAGSNPASVEEVMTAVKMAGIEEMIQRLPMGLRTPVTEGGATFSGGQRQAIMIARALLTRPRILFLDEVTSALDNRFQARLVQSLEELGMTRVVVTQNPFTMRHAQRLYVVVGGRIVQCGDYASLLATDGPFADLMSQ